MIWRKVLPARRLKGLPQQSGRCRLICSRWAPNNASEWTSKLLRTAASGVMAKALRPMTAGNINGCKVVRRQNDPDAEDEPLQMARQHRDRLSQGGSKRTRHSTAPAWPLSDGARAISIRPRLAQRACQLFGQEWACRPERS